MHGHRQEQSRKQIQRAVLIRSICICSVELSRSGCYIRNSSWGELNKVAESHSLVFFLYHSYYRISLELFIIVINV